MVTVLGLCACLCVCLRSTDNEAAYERYQQHQYNKRSKIKMAILLKTTAFEIERLALSSLAEPLRRPSYARLGTRVCEIMLIISLIILFLDSQNLNLFFILYE